MINPVLLLERVGIDEFEIDEKTREVFIPERYREKMLPVFGVEYLKERVLGIEKWGWKWLFVKSIWEKEREVC